MLTELYCYNNQIPSLDVSQNKLLVEFSIWNNHIETLDLSKNTRIETLNVKHNRLTQLDLSKNTKIKTLYIQNNLLTDLDLNKNTAITYLDCHKNELTSLNFFENTALTFIDCHKNLLTSIDISKNLIFIEDFDAEEITDEILAEWYQPSKEQWDIRNRNLWGKKGLPTPAFRIINMAEVSCTIKHIKAMELIAENGDGFIIEDDVLLKDNFVKRQPFTR